MKIIKNIAIVFVVLVLAVSGILYFYKDALIKKLVQKINRDYNIEIAYNNVDLGIIKSFPYASLTINDLLVANESPFKGDTLVFVKKLNLVLNGKDIFNKNAEKIHIKNVTVNGANVNLLVDSLGRTNYDIHYIKEQKTQNNTPTTNNQEFTFDVKKYQILKSDFLFKDQHNKFVLFMKGLNHSGSGDFSASVSDLKTNTKIDAFTLKYGNVKYLNKVKIVLDALLKMDLTNMKFTLKENDLQLNDLHLKLDGYVQHNSDSEDINLNFNAPKTNFKSVLSLIPNAYSANFKDVKASGTANISGFVKGIYADNIMPKYSVKIDTKNAFFQYPDLPKSIKNISFTGELANKSTKHIPFLKLDKMRFSIDQDTFETTGIISNLIENPTVDASFKGKLNLDNFYKAYPIKLDNKIGGILQADFHTNLDMKSVENNNYKKIKTNGVASLQDFSYSDRELKNPFYVDNADIQFNTNTIKLTDFKAKSGKSDVWATGTLDNLYAFLFDDKKLKGNFKMTSSNFVISDFLMQESNVTQTEKPSGSTENLKIPDFLDITTTAKAKRVVYDDIVLEDVSTLMKIKDQKAILTNTKAKMMRGQATFDGFVDTKQSPAKFKFNLDLNKFDIATSFSEIETFQKLAPIANAVKGKFNSDFSISGNLKDDFTPDLYSLSGKILAQLFVKDVNESANPLFTALTSQLKFIDLKKINFNKLKTKLEFKNGKVNVKPFDIKYKDITIHVKGSHGFDKSLLYHLNMDLPAKYLGKEAQTMLAKLSNMNKDTLKVPLYTLIKGTFDKPIVKANFEQAIKELAVKVVKYQKQQLLNQATNQVENVVDDALANTGLDSILPVKSDSTKTNPKDIITQGVSNVLGNLFKKKKKDTTK